MATCAMRTGWLASVGTSKYSSICPKILQSALVYPNVLNSTTILTQKSNETDDEEPQAIARYNLMPPRFRLHRDIIFSLEDLFVLPIGLDVGILGVTAYFITRLKKADPSNVAQIFGPDPWSKESELHPEKVVKCIAHRGASLDAPENTMQAFKYCVDRDCNFVELDVRSSRDGHLVLLHDEGLGRLTGAEINNVHVMDWDEIKNIDIGANHPNRQQFKEVHLCLLDDALKYLLANDVRVIIDVKGEDKEVVDGIVKAFSDQPNLHQRAVVTSFNPFVLYRVLLEVARRALRRLVGQPAAGEAVLARSSARPLPRQHAAGGA
ncbi:Glycerophosphodiester phosphodiesterase 1 [Papilio machaon]|uniref:Glycerophosphodiester phosphodiesterase 1 n=1 Tax=Papilio machaon TaxID=76193 RepID=A0A0N1IGR1_PAPMA|nr:Glycerophosphodiester phosphodiesterase 1 [Papilio machaon]